VEKVFATGRKDVPQPTVPSQLFRRGKVGVQSQLTQRGKERLRAKQLEGNGEAAFRERTLPGRVKRRIMNERKKKKKERKPRGRVWSSQEETFPMREMH